MGISVEHRRLQPHDFQQVLDLFLCLRITGCLTVSEKKETPILKAEHLTKMFPVKKRKLIEKQKYVHAAEDVSFEVYPGEVLA